MANTARGHIEQLPSGSFRVHVYAGTDPVTGRPRRLRETCPTFLDQLGVHLVRPARRRTRDRAPEPVEQRLLRMRQWIEAIFDTLKGQLSLEQHGARRPDGIYARVGQRLLAMAAAIWHNTLIDAPRKRSLIAYDH